MMLKNRRIWALIAFSEIAVDPSGKSTVMMMRRPIISVNCIS